MEENKKIPLNHIDKFTLKVFEIENDDEKTEKLNNEKKEKQV